ncbi:CusA/CzcA family heavy metal efflux RND transporter [Duganella sp. FT135W]|uniref:CusA/CzcA family heavy metal efflux RND transporter n=1 Tax=Duganella flavida TaxID=2692175 RepID=A0A6L8KDV0_9BURK|nr:CusA/CzcA family heavy metal efflux RND transporter [Duganella flavida]MYM22611.1 CusA/CzcA family heavy metal efflux RND transporter [Duganella flavida]
MIARIIDWSVRNRLMVLALCLLLLIGGIESLFRLKLDALPDLSDVQVIVKTDLPGRSPQLVEDQLTYPLAASLLSVPGTKAVRGFSMFGESYVYVIFKDGTDLYWARSRILESLSQSSAKLPAGAAPTLGPDASGVGWVFEYALVDKSGKVPPAQLRALQDFYLKLELQSVPGVAEVATLGGQARQFQVEADPARLAAHGVSLEQLSQAIKDANQTGGGAPLEMARAEYLLRSNGYLNKLDDFDDIPVPTDAGVLRLKQLANVTTGPQQRRGIADLNGAGDVTGGIIVMRHGENALTTIAGVKARLEQLKKGLPAGVEIVTTYDRSGLIERVVHTLRDKLLEESIVVALICGVFLFRIRSALVAIVTLPLGILAALWLMRIQGVSANIMSLGGIAIAVGAMVDAAIVMIENMHRHLERQHADDIWLVVRKAASEVGPALFFSLVIITISFLPVFTLSGQEVRLFAPLAYTKTYAMAAAAMLAITLTPVLMGYAIGGKLPSESANPVNRFLKQLYRPALGAALRRPKTTLVLALALLATALIPFSRIGSEFMPPLDEGDLLYMPTTLPAISASEAADLLQRTDAIIAAMPEVARVFGKAGRSDSATDPAPLSMLETTIMLKPKSQWPAGSSKSNADLIAKLDATVRLAGLTNSWGFPIKTRIDMLSTGIRSALGVKISGPDLATLETQAKQVEAMLRPLPGTRSVFAERIQAGRYIDVEVLREAAARYGLSVADIQRALQMALGGESISTVVEGRERYPVTLRFPRADRNGVEALEEIRLKAAGGAIVPLREVARIGIADGPTELKSENARPVAYVFIDLADADAGRYLEQAQQLLDEHLVLPPGYTLSWQGQYMNFKQGKARLWSAIAMTLLLVSTLLFLHFRDLRKVALVLACLPFSVIGGIWLTYLLGYQLSVAVVIGMIALAGVATEFGIVMLLYLDQALCEQPADTYAAILSGALLRLRPKAMTVAVILGGLLPVMISDDAGADVMKRIAAPLLGGMITAPLFSLIVIPAVYWLALRPESDATRQGENA